MIGTRFPCNGANRHFAIIRQAAEGGGAHAGTLRFPHENSPRSQPDMTTNSRAPA